MALITINYKERRRREYLYTCLGCSKKRRTVKKKRLQTGLCRKCRKEAIPANQIRLFNINKTGEEVVKNE